MAARIPSRSLLGLLDLGRKKPSTNMMASQRGPPLTHSGWPSLAQHLMSTLPWRGGALWSQRAVRQEAVILVPCDVIRHSESRMAVAPSPQLSDPHPHPQHLPEALEPSSAPWLPVTSPPANLPWCFVPAALAPSCPQACPVCCCPKGLCTCHPLSLECASCGPVWGPQALCIRSLFPSSEAITVQLS